MGHERKLREIDSFFVAVALFEVVHIALLCVLFEAMFFLKNLVDVRLLCSLFFQDWPKGRYICVRKCRENIKQTAKKTQFLWKFSPCFPHKNSFFYVSLYLLSQETKFCADYAHCSSRFTSGSVRVNYCKLEKLFYKFFSLWKHLHWKQTRLLANMRDDSRANIRHNSCKHTFNHNVENNKEIQNILPVW